LGKTWVCVGVERTVFEVELVDNFVKVAVLGDAQLDVGELGYKGVGNAASGVGVVDPWDVPKDGERGRMGGWRKSLWSYLKISFRHLRLGPLNLTVIFPGLQLKLAMKEG
jgi:hypothetical protein